jgi:hypothetical protein
VTRLGSALQQTVTWIVQPPLEAGLDLEQVLALLLYRVSFECVVAGGRCEVSDVSEFLGPQPVPVRAAWVETVDRMLRAGDIITAS